MESVEEILKAWRREISDLEIGPFESIVRATHLARVIDTFERRVLEPFEISPSEHEILAALRRCGTPYRLSPGALCRLLDRSSGGMTKMLKRLEAGGYVERVSDPEDGRGLLVVLSRRGIELQGRIFAAYVAAGRNRLGGLGRAGLEEIEDAMQRLSESLDR